MTEDADCDLGVVQDVLQRLPERNDGGLVMLARPAIEVPIRLALHFPCTRKQPRMLHADADTSDVPQEEVEVDQAQIPDVILLRRYR